MIEPLLRAEDIKKYFPLARTLFRKAEFVKAVDGVDLEVRKGETLGLVGESGCGKTTLGRVILRLIEPTSGRLFFEGKDLLHCRKEELRLLRKSIQVIFQDPFSSLNPRMTVGGIIGRNLKAQGIRPEGGMGPYIESLLEAVGLRPEFTDRYPHEFSGGQRQRIAIARALSTRPKLIIADEPTSALDVSVQAQILNLLLDLQKKNDLTFIFISHNIRVVRHVSHRMGVMYLGKIVEIGPKRELFANPCHPYTRGLLASILEPDPNKKMDEAPLAGEIPSPIHPPAGYRFGRRCPLKEQECTVSMPPLKEVSPEHYVACHLDERTLRTRS